MVIFSGLRTAVLVAAAGTAFLLFGCSSAGVPSTAAVQKAFSAFNSADTGVESTDDYSSSSSYNSSGSLSNTVTNPSGTGQASLSFTSSTSGNPMTVKGSITFTNWTDPQTGYTLNGTININESVTTSGSTETITATITGTLNLTGGSISTLAFNLTDSGTFNTSTYAVSASFSGTITADGHPYDASTIA